MCPKHISAGQACSECRPLGKPLPRPRRKVSKKIKLVVATQEPVTSLTDRQKSALQHLANAEFHRSPFPADLAKQLGKKGLAQWDGTHYRRRELQRTIVANLPRLRIMQITDAGKEVCRELGFLESDGL